jgi:flavorubredoxin
VKAIERELTDTGIEVLDSSLSVKFVPDDRELKRCAETGRTIATKISGQ